jgi:hypothetical protein
VSVCVCTCAQAVLCVGRVHVCDDSETKSTIVNVLSQIYVFVCLSQWREFVKRISA